MGEELKYIPDFKVKVAIKKILEVSYSKEDGAKMSAVLKKGPITLKLDNNGNVKTSAKIGRIDVRGDSKINALGTNFKFINIRVSEGDNGDVVYDAIVSYGVFQTSVRGSFSIDAFLSNNSGLLGGAYRGIKDRDQQLKEALGESGI